MVSNAGPGSYAVDLHKHMEVYDSLPARIRQLMNEAPIPQDLWEVHQLIIQVGEEPARRLIIQAFQETYPGWHPGMFPERPRRSRR
jgi:hypothetical protein